MDLADFMKNLQFLPVLPPPPFPPVFNPDFGGEEGGGRGWTFPRITTDIFQYTYVKIIFETFKGYLNDMHIRREQSRSSFWLF